MSILHIFLSAPTSLHAIPLFTFSETAILVSMVCLTVMVAAWLINRGLTAHKRYERGVDTMPEREGHAEAATGDTGQPTDEKSAQEIEEIRLNSVRACLKSLNIQYKEEQNKNDGTYCFDLSYQSGVFILILRPIDAPSELVYPNFYQGDELILDYVREIANELSGSLFVQSLNYIFNENTNKYILNLSATVHVSKKEGLDKEYFVNLLQEFFSCAHSITSALYKYQKNQKEELSYDNERNTHYYARIRYLVMEETLRSENLPIPTHYNNTEELRLGQVLQILDDIPSGICYRSLEISGRPDQPLHEAERIENLNLLEIFPKLPEDGPAILHLSYALSGEKEKGLCIEKETESVLSTPTHHLLLMLTTEGQTEESRYVRVLVSGYSDTHGQMPHFLPGSKAPFCKELRFSLCDQTPDKKLIEFDYLWQDAKDKVREGKQKELTQEQLLIVATEDDRTAYWIYWGEHYYLNNESARAILYLENAFQRMETRFTELDSKELERFYKVRFLLGDSYRRLGNFKMAHNYLCPTENSHCVEHSISYVKCLMESGDYRAYEYVTGILSNFEKQQQNPDYEPIPELEAYHQYLRRTQVLLFLRSGETRQAKQILHDMLGEEENKKFAADLLKDLYIKERENTIRNMGNTGKEDASSGDEADLAY